MWYSYPTPLQQPATLCAVQPKTSCSVWCLRINSCNQPRVYRNCPFAPCCCSPLVGGAWLGSSAKGTAKKKKKGNKGWSCKSNPKKHHVEKLHLRFWNCCAVYLVRRIPKPSISASRIPPIIAEPTMVNGPPCKKKTTYFLFSPAHL